MIMVFLSKSDYILGLECPKYLWIKINHPDKIKKPSIADEFKFREGYKVGKEAVKLCPDGIDLSM